MVQPSKSSQLNDRDLKIGRKWRVGCMRTLSRADKETHGPHHLSPLRPPTCVLWDRVLLTRPSLALVPRPQPAAGLWGCLLRRQTNSNLNRDSEYSNPQRSHLTWRKNIKNSILIYFLKNHLAQVLLIVHIHEDTGTLLGHKSHSMSHPERRPKVTWVQGVDSRALLGPHFQHFVPCGSSCRPT